jgi:hypothetical protein
MSRLEHTMTRPLLVAAVATLLALVIWWTRADTYRAPSVTAPSGPDVSRAAIASYAAPKAAAHAAVPNTRSVTHQPHATDAELDDFGAWLTSTFPRAEPAFLGVDCTAPPCLIGVQFLTKDLSSSEIGVLMRGVRTEVERRLGFAMAVVHSDQDREGRDYLWMYGLPADVSDEQRHALRSSAEARYSARMAPLRPPPVTPLPDR